MSEPQDRSDNTEPGWLQAMRLAAVQRPRTRFVKIQWASLQPLLRERDALWIASTPETRAMIEAMRQADDYGYRRPPGMYANYQVVQNPPVSVPPQGASPDVPAGYKVIGNTVVKQD